MNRDKTSLTDEIADLRKRLAELEPARTERDRYRFLVDMFPDAMLILSVNSEILDCNEVALSLFGYSRQEILSLSGRDLMPGEVAGRYPEILSEENTTGGAFVWVSIRRKDGKVLPAGFSSRMITLGGEKVFFVCMRDLVVTNPAHTVVSSLVHEERKEKDGRLPVLDLTWRSRSGRFVLIGYSKEVEVMSGGAITSFVGRNAEDIYGYQPSIIEDLRNCFETRAMIRRKTPYRTFTTGEDFFMEITNVFVPPNMIVTHMEDISEREEEKLLYRTLARNSPVGVCIVQDSSFMFVNSTLEEMSGYTHEELMRMEPERLIFPGDRTFVRDMMARVLAGEVTEPGLSYRIMKKDGKVRWTLFTANSIIYRQNPAVVLDCLDISELKEVQDRVDELAALQASILAAIPHAVLGLRYRKIIFANDAVYSVFGWRPEELIGRTMRVLFRNDHEYEKQGRLIYSELEKQKTFSLETNFVKKDGSRVVCLMSISGIEEGIGDGRVVASYTDITARKNVEESLKLSEERLALAMEATSDGLWDWNFRTGNIYLSPRSFTMLGYEPNEIAVTFRSLEDFIHPDDREMTFNVIDEYLNRKRGHTGEVECRMKTKSGVWRWIHAKGRVMEYDDEGRPIRILGANTDVTERKLWEKELEQSREQLRIHAENLQTMLEGERTRIAREIHDELGQILTALKMDLSWLTKKVPSDAENVQGKVHSMIDLVDDTIRAVQRISLRLRPGMLDDLGLTAAIEWQAGAFQARSGVECMVSFNPDPDEIVSDKNLATALFRILQEALTNVARHSGATRAEVSFREKDGSVEMKIRDNGKGITKKQMDDSKSIGIIGIRERVNLLGGNVKIYGRKDRGTTVRVVIPLDREEKGNA